MLRMSRSSAIRFVGERRAMKVVSPRCFARAVRRFLGAGVLALCAASAPAADLSGYWTLDLKRSEIRIDQAALTPTAQARVREFNPTKHDPTTVCMPYGMPRVMTALGAYPMEIVQTDSQVTMIFDAHDEVRRVMFVKKEIPKDELAPLWLGYASGKWDGDALIVETIGITDQSLVNDSGVPHSSDLRVTERIRRIDSNTLLNEMTLHDAQAFGKPVTRKLYYTSTPELQQREFHCAEQMWLDHVMSRAKELTRELAEKKQ
jgi:hypothetical protein